MKGIKSLINFYSIFMTQIYLKKNKKSKNLTLSRILTSLFVLFRKMKEEDKV